MDVISLLLGILSTILTMSKMTRKYIMRLVLCFFSSFSILKFKYSDLELWSIQDYFDKANFNDRFIWLYNNNILIYSIVIAVVFYLFYYWILRLLLEKYLYKHIGGIVIKKVILKGRINDFITGLSNFYLKYFDFMFKHRILTVSSLINKGNKSDEDIYEHEIKDSVLGYLCMLLNIEFCIFFTFKYSSMVVIILSLILVALLIIAATVTPLIYKYRKVVFNKTIRHLNSLIQ